MKYAKTEQLFPYTSVIMDNFFPVSWSSFFFFLQNNSFKKNYS